MGAPEAHKLQESQRNQTYFVLKLQDLSDLLQKYLQLNRNIQFHRNQYKDHHLFLKLEVLKIRLNNFWGHKTAAILNDQKLPSYHAFQAKLYQDIESENLTNPLHQLLLLHLQFSAWEWKYYKNVYLRRCSLCFPPHPQTSFPVLYNLLWRRHLIPPEAPGLNNH